MDKELLQHVPTCATKSDKKVVDAGRQPQSSLLRAAVDKTTRCGRIRVRRTALVAPQGAKACL